jgi:hypothetical protein
MIGIVSPRAAVFWSCVLLSLAAAAAPAPTCTSQNVRGFPIAGTVCGGSTHAMSCSAGAIYECKSGPLGQTNNCTLVRACPIGCQTGPTSGNIVDSCWSGADPLTLSTTNTLGGNDVGFNLTLSASHTGVAYTHMSINRGDLVPGSYCAVPDLQPGVSSVNFALPTAVVPSATDVTLHSFVSWTDPSGSSHELVSNETVLTLNGGGKEPPTPAIASFTLSPSSIAAGGTSFMDVHLTRMAPARGVSIAVSSSNPSVASVIANGQPTILGGCTDGGGAATISAASSVPRATTVSISATSGDPAHTVVVNPLTVTP